MPKTAKTRAAHTNGHRDIVGRRGTIRFGQRQLKVIVVEDRGPVGHSGRQLLRVRIDESPAESSDFFEVPAEDLILSATKA